MSFDCSKYDHLLLEVLQGEGQISPFLDVIFSFLYRRTDFFKILHNSTENMGFPPGYAERLVHSAFNRYHTLAVQYEEEYQRNAFMEKTDSDVPPALSTVEITDENCILETKCNLETKPKKQSLCDKPSSERTQKDFQCSNKSHNGAQREQFCWSQNATDVDVHVMVPEHVTSAKCVKVNLTTTHLKVSILETSGNYKDLIDDDLLYSVMAEAAIWNLFPKEHIFISMEKCENRWWNSLLKTEPKINVNEIDNSQPFEELDEESKAKIQQLMFDEQQKATGKPTSEQIKLESVLKAAWNAKGSPFEGQPYDPSLL